MVHWSDVERVGLSLPEASLGEAHEGSPAVKVRNTQFARLRIGDGRGEVLQFWVADPDLVLDYRARDPVIFSGLPGYSKKVVLALLDRLDDQLLHELLIESWLCRAPRSLVRQHPDLTRDHERN